MKNYMPHKIKRKNVRSKTSNDTNTDANVKQTHSYSNENDTIIIVLKGK